MVYIRPHARELEKRILEPRGLIQVVAGSRQVGKTTLVCQVCERLRLPCRYASADEPSINKMLGQLLDAGNTTTLAHYLELLAGAGMATGIQKFAGEAVRSRGSSPKLLVYNTALVGAHCGLTLDEAKRNGNFWGRLVESAVGAHLANAAASGAIELFYWREGNREVDFVVRRGRKVSAIEVKSGPASENLPGLETFSRSFQVDRKLLVGGDGIPVEVFLEKDPLTFLD